MNSHIPHLKKHLSEQPPVCLSDEYESLLDVLYYAYAEHSTSDSAQIKECLTQLDSLTRHLPFQAQDSILTAALSLSAAQARQSFHEGVRTGAGLILELCKE